MLNEQGEYLEHGPRVDFSCVMAGAVLADLALERRIETDLERLYLVDSAPTGDARIRLSRKLPRPKTERPLANVGGMERLPAAGRECTPRSVTRKKERFARSVAGLSGPVDGVRLSPREQRVEPVLSPRRREVRRRSMLRARKEGVPCR